MLETYKTINLLSPSHMWNLFTKKVVGYDFRIKILCELPPARLQKIGLNSLKFKGSQLCNGLGDEVKTAQSLGVYK